MRKMLLTISVLLADWANGIFAVVGAAWLTSTEVVWWHFFVGMALAHLPDLDAVPELLRHGRVGAGAEQEHDHREGLHYPVPVLLVAFGLAPFVGYWGWVLAFNILLHFVNDLYGTGWGLKLFWPVSNRNYKLLGRRVNRMRSILTEDGDWELVPQAERKLKFVVSWSDQELPTYIRKWGMEDWMEQCYARFNWVVLIEAVLFGGAVGLMLFYL